QQGSPALGRLRQPRHGVGEPRPLMDRAQADGPRHPGVGVGRGNGARLVPGGDEPEALLLQGIAHMEVAAAQQAEDTAKSGSGLSLEPGTRSPTGTGMQVGSGMRAGTGRQPGQGGGHGIVNGNHQPASPPRGTRASTRAGLPVPPTMGKGATTITAPVGGRWARLASWVRPYLPAPWKK